MFVLRSDGTRVLAVAHIAGERGSSVLLAMLVVVVVVLGVAVPVVQVIDVVVVLDAVVPAAWSVPMLMLGRLMLAVFRGGGHFAALLLCPERNRACA